LELLVSLVVMLEEYWYEQLVIVFVGTCDGDLRVCQYLCYVMVLGFDFGFLCIDFMVRW